MSEPETNDVLGVKADGTQVNLGSMPLDPRFKMREIVRNYFSELTDDANDASDANMALWCLRDFYAWLLKQREAAKPSSSGRDTSWLPELPDCEVGLGSHRWAYSAEQMHEFALDAVQQYELLKQK